MILQIFFSKVPIHGDEFVLNPGAKAIYVLKALKFDRLLILEALPRGRRWNSGYDRRLYYLKLDAEKWRMDLLHHVEIDRERLSHVIIINQASANDFAIPLGVSEFLTGTLAGDRIILSDELLKMDTELCYVKWDGNVMCGFVTHGYNLVSHQVCEYDLVTKQMRKYDVGTVINLLRSHVSFIFLTIYIVFRMFTPGLAIASMLLTRSRCLRSTLSIALG
jgi:hypothetical protein